MSADDRALDAQTIANLRERLAMMTQVKDGLLATNRALAEQVTELKKLLSDLDYERECLLLDLHHLRNELDKQMK